MKSQSLTGQRTQVQTDSVATSTSAWVSHSLQLKGVSLLDFLRQYPQEARFFFENDRLPLALAACGVAASVLAQGSQRFETIRQQLEARSAQVFVTQAYSPKAVRPRWFGGFSFRSGHRPEGVWAGFPAARFVLPRRQLARIDGQSWLTLTDEVRPGESLTQAQRRLAHEAHQFSMPKAVSDFPRTLCKGRLEWLMGQSQWRALVEAAIERIHHKALEKVVLAQACRLQMAGPIDPIDALGRLKQVYPQCYRFLVAPHPGQVFFGSSPELLAQVNENHVETVSMASSIRRGQTPEEDQALGEKLMASAKERHEHAVVVQSIQKRLKALTRQLAISNEPEIVRFYNIQHLQTKIQGELLTPCGILPVVEAMHPTPAMGGTPRPAALAFIEQTEPFQRGWYASPVGWVDLEGNGLFAVAIRSAVVHQAHAQLFAGAGIVNDSDPDREWAEVQLKFRPMLEALGQHTQTIDPRAHP